MSTDTIATEGIESFEIRLQIARQALARKSASVAEKADLIAEIEWWDSRIALASVGRHPNE